jgi:hypothetical protein
MKTEKFYPRFFSVVAVIKRIVNIMSSDDALIPIRKTLEALDRIQERLNPHLRTLRQKESHISADNQNNMAALRSKERYVKAEAQAAIALTLGTLHYMNAKLHGAAQARVELNKTRQLIETLRKVDPRLKVDTSASETKNVPCNGKETSAESEDELTTIQEGGIQEREEGSGKSTNLSSTDTSHRKDGNVGKAKKRKR